MATVYKNTYYGPVGQKSQTGTTAIDDQTQGSLTQLILQPSDQSPAISKNSVGRYVEKWKGPYSMVKDLPTSKFGIGFTRDYALQLLGQANYVARFSAPNPGKDRYGKNLTWIIESVTVQELEAGDHAIMTVNYVNIADDQQSDPWTSDPKDDVWTIQWQSYSVSPYAFCKNKPVEDQPFGLSASIEDTAWRTNIEKAIQSGEADKSWNYPIDGRSYKVHLNVAEAAIAEKVLKNVNAQWHFPVITHQTSMSKQISAEGTAELSNVSYPYTIGDHVDHFEEELSGCPYTFPKDVPAAEQWKWLKVGDDMTQSKQDFAMYQHDVIKFTRRETWWGIKDPDINFYGSTPLDHTSEEGILSGRWELGKL